MEETLFKVATGSTSQPQRIVASLTVTWVLRVATLALGVGVAHTGFVVCGARLPSAFEADVGLAGDRIRGMFRSCRRLRRL